MKEQNNTNIVPKQEPKNQRQIARKILLSTIINNEYVIEKEQEPNYLKVAPNLKIYRANVIAVVVGKEKIGMITNLLLDDSSGKITARIFEESKSIKNVEVGDCIQLIGKIRIYNEEKYISPEIVKKIDTQWLKLRSVELKKSNEKNSEQENNIISGKDNINVTEKKKQKEKKIEIKNIQPEQVIETLENKKVKIKEQESKEEFEKRNFEQNKYQNIPNKAQNFAISPPLQNAEKSNDFSGAQKQSFLGFAHQKVNYAKSSEENHLDNDLIENLSLPSEKIIKLIKEIDKGQGVFIEEIIEKSPINDTEKVIQKMLENGDIFQNHPGKVKIL